ncbi:ATP-binding cassette, sub-B (MDR TAP), member 4 [Borealophlyctis nickersoniae]|nr:ATP-binding cassette, sub-B (MDR TAP), member 4 [Borealophlyctis nickersoniae]
MTDTNDVRLELVNPPTTDASSKTRWWQRKPKNPPPRPPRSDSAGLELAAATSDAASETESMKSKREKQDKKKNEPKLGYLQLYRHATPFDYLLILGGTICALAAGAGMPLMTIIFSDVLGAFIEYVPGGEDKLNDAARTGSLQFLFIAIGMFVVGYGQMSLWMWSGENQAKEGGISDASPPPAATNYKQRIRELYFEALLRQDVAYYDKTTTGEVTTRLSGDIDIIQQGLSEKLGMIIQFLTTFTGGFIIAYIKGWKLALVLTSVVPLLAGVAIIISTFVSARSEEGQDSYASAGGVAQQVLSAIRTVVAFGGEEREEKRYRKYLAEAEKSAIKKSVLAGGGVAAINLLMFGVYSLAFWYGSTLIRQRSMTPAEVINVFFAIIIGAFTLGQAAPHLAVVSNAQGAAYKIFQTIDRPSPIDGLSTVGLTPPAVEGRFEFKNVGFSYPARGDVKVLENFNLSVTPGSTVALVGMSGSGKSTIVKLIERFYDPTEGSVTLDGVDLKDLNVRWLRQQIGIVSQEPSLFDTTIRKNILYGLKEDPTSYSETELNDKIEQACRVANAWTFIQKLPHGLDTSVGESGSMLSGGQKQRIAIARAVIRNPRILLLDEATSALDTESERLVQSALESASKDRTTVVIAHRLSTVKNADVIVVMDRGVVVEQGTHESLIAQGGVYAELVAAQKIKTGNGGTAGETTTDSLSDLEDETIKPESIVPLDHNHKVVADGLVIAIDPTPKTLTRRKSVTASRRSSIKSAADVEKEKQEKEEEEKELAKRKPPLGRILRMNKPEYWMYALGITAATINGIWMPLFAIIFSSILVVFANPDLDQMQKDANFWALMFLLLALASGLVSFIQIALLRIAGDKLTTRLRAVTFAALLRQEIGFFDQERNSTGALTAKLAQDANLVQGLTGQNFAQIAQLVSTGVSGLVIAFVYSWQLTLVVLSTVPFMAVASYLEMAAMSGFSAQTAKSFVQANRIASETIESVRTVQTLTRESTFLRDYNANIVKPHKTALKSAFLSSLGYAFSQSAPFLAYALAYYYGSRLMLWGLYGQEAVLKVMFAIIFAAMAAGQASTFAPDAAKARVAANSIMDLLDRVPRIDSRSSSGTVPTNRQGDASTDKAHFSYPIRPDIPVLRGLDVTAKHGTTVALVGQSGCGKSTILGLLERWYDVSKGQAIVDDLNVKDWQLKQLREQMALVGQEPILFDISIRENIAYGAVDGTATFEEIQAAARMANIHDFVVSLPKGYDTIVGEKGGQLSGGQKQRVAIARALIRNPKILLLDEATSALDSESEKVVQEALDVASKGRTTIVIAHRLSTVQNADTIYVIRDGVVAEQGTHFELMEKKGAYFELAVQQTLHKE